MKKILLSIIGAAVIGGVVLFTSFGNENLLLPLANSFLKKKISDHRIRLTHLEIYPKSTVFTVSVDDGIKIEFYGPVEWIERKFALRYKANGRELVIGKRKYPVQIDINGTASGIPEMISVKGKGYAFNAGVHYGFNIKKGDLAGIDLTVNRANISQMLLLAGIPSYAEGVLNAEIKMPRLDMDSAEGSAKIHVQNGLLNKGAIIKSLGVSIPGSGKYSLDMDFELKKRLIVGKGQFLSDVLNMKMDRVVSDSLFRVVKGSYILDLPMLGKLRSLSGVKLKGSAKFSGKIYFDRRKNRLQILADTKVLDGNTRIFYNDKRVDIKFKNCLLEKAESLFGVKSGIRKGIFGGIVKISDIKSYEGRYDLRLNGIIDRIGVLRQYNLKIPRSMKMKAHSRGRIKNLLLEADGTLNSPGLDLRFDDLKLSFIAQKLQSRYKVRLKDISYFLAGAKSLGKAVDAEGEIKYDIAGKSMQMNGSSRSFSGNSEFEYMNGSLKIKLKGTDPAEIARVFGERAVFGKSVMNAAINFSDTKNLKGTIEFDAGGKLDRKKIKARYGTDIGSDLPVKIKGKSRIDKQTARGKIEISSSLAKAKIDKLIYRFKKGIVEGRYRVEIPELLRLEPMTGRKYRGAISTLGSLFAKGDKVVLRGSIRKWNGDVKYRYSGNMLKMSASRVDFSKLLYTLGYSPLIEAVAKGNADYNFATEKGKAKIELSDAHFVKSSLSDAITVFLNYDFSREIFRKALFVSDITHRYLIFDFNANSKHVKLNVSKGRINRIAGTIDAVLNIDDRGRKYRVKLKGPVSKPLVVPLMGDILKNKAGKIIKKKLPKELKDAPVNELINKLF